MNFQHYFAQLETPIFSFYEFDNQEVIKQYLDKVDDYLNTKKENTSIKRNLFNLLVELMQQTRKADKGELNFYEIPNGYVVASKMQISAQYTISIQHIAPIIERGNNIELKELYKSIIKNELPTTLISFFRANKYRKARRKSLFFGGRSRDGGSGVRDYCTNKSLKLIFT